MLGDVLIGAVTGIIAGGVFFGGLQWTVRRLTVTTRPGLLAAGSFVIRSVVVIVLFLLLTDGRFLRAVTGLGGLILVRTLMVWRVRQRSEPVQESTWI